MLRCCDVCMVWGYVWCWCWCVYKVMALTSTPILVVVSVSVSVKWCDVMWCDDMLNSALPCYAAYDIVDPRIFACLFVCVRMYARQASPPTAGWPPSSAACRRTGSSLAARLAMWCLACVRLCKAKRSWNWACWPRARTGGPCCRGDSPCSSSILGYVRSYNYSLT